MHLLNPLVFALLAGVGQSIATTRILNRNTPSPKYSAVPDVANFEDAGFNTISFALPVGTYREIRYNGFTGVQDVVPPNNGGTAAISPQSPPNYIAGGLPNTGTITQGTPTMTVVYDESPVAFFNLTSFFYACTLADATAANCTIAATCLDGNQQVVAAQDFGFAANGQLEQNMVQGKPKAFKGCGSVRFVPLGTQGASGAAIALLLDTIGLIKYKLIG